MSRVPGRSPSGVRPIDNRCMYVKTPIQSTLIPTRPLYSRLSGYDALARWYGNFAFSLRIGASNNRHDSHASANAGAVAAA